MAETDNNDMENIIDIIRAERIKQKELWSSEHDDQHVGGELIDVVTDLLMAYQGTGYVGYWGLAKKHKCPRKRLVIAAALIVAELERLDRKKEARDDG